MDIFTNYNSSKAYDFSSSSGLLLFYWDKINYQIIKAKIYKTDDKFL